MQPEITIPGLNAHQVMLADMLWAAQTEQQVDAVIAQFGQEARVVQEMILAAYLDTLAETDLAQQVLDQFRV